MEDKEALEILTSMLDRDMLSEKERQAILTAVGILSWSKLGQGRIKNIIKSQKAKRAWNLKGRDTTQFSK